MKELGGLFYSARRVMTPESVDIVILSNVNESRFAAPPCTAPPIDRHGKCKLPYLRRFAVQMLRFTPSRNIFGKAYPILSSPLVYRFFLYHALAQTRCHRSYLFVDTRDIFFQADPFASAGLWNDAFVVTLEAELEYNARGEAGRRLPFGGTQKPEMYNINCVGELWGKEAASRMPINDSVVSSGVLGGGGASLRHFLGTYLRIALEAGARLAIHHPWVTDQIFLNYLVRHPDARAQHLGFRLTLLRNEVGPVLHVVWPLVRRYNDRPFSVQTPSRNATPAVVHLFDRSPELTHGLQRALQVAGLPSLHIMSNGVAGWGHNQ